MNALNLFLFLQRPEPKEQPSPISFRTSLVYFTQGEAS